MRALPSSAPEYWGGVRLDKVIIFLAVNPFLQMYSDKEAPDVRHESRSLLLHFFSIFYFSITDGTQY